MFDPGNILCLKSNKVLCLTIIFILFLFTTDFSNAQIKKLEAPGDFAFSTNFSFGDVNNEISCSNDSCTAYTQRFFVRNDTSALLYYLGKNQLQVVDTFAAYWYNEKGDILKVENKVNSNLYSKHYFYNAQHKLQELNQLQEGDTTWTERYTYNADGKLAKVVGGYFSNGQSTIAWSRTYDYFQNGSWQESEIFYSDNEVIKRTLRRYDNRARILLDWLDDDGDGDYEKRKSYEYHDDLTIEYDPPYRIMTFRDLPMAYAQKVRVYKDGDYRTAYLSASKPDSIFSIIGVNHFDTSAVLPLKSEMESIYRNHNEASVNTYYNALGYRIRKVVVLSDELGGSTDRSEIKEYAYDTAWRLKEIISRFKFPVYKTLKDHKGNPIIDFEVDDMDGAGRDSQIDFEALSGDVQFHMVDYSDFTLDSTVTAREWFIYDDNANLTEKYACNYSRNTCYGFVNEYDTLNRLIKKSRWTGAIEKRVFDKWIHLYTYDEDGFLKSHSEGEERQLHTLKYDANGNTTFVSGRKTYYGNQQFKRSMGGGLAHTLEIKIPNDGMWEFDLYESNFGCVMRLTSSRSEQGTVIYPIEYPSQKVNNPTYNLQKGTYYFHLVGAEYEDRGIYRLRINGQ